MYVIVSRYGLTADVPTLPIGVIGYDTDTKTLRVGDGTSSPPRIITDKSSGEFDLSNLTMTLPDALIASLSTPGNNGWTPEFALIINGERRLLKVVDWTGGEGTKPTVDLYASATGLDADANVAIDIRGPQGPPGSSPAIMFNINGNGDLVLEQDDTTLTRPISASIDANGDLLVAYSDSNEATHDLNLGRVLVIFQGAWDNATQYEHLDEVTYSNGLFRGKRVEDIPIGTLPSDTDYWDVLIPSS